MTRDFMSLKLAFSSLPSLFAVRARPETTAPVTSLEHAVTDYVCNYILHGGDQREFLESLPEIVIARVAPDALPDAVAAALTRLGIAARPGLPAAERRGGPRPPSLL